MASIILMGFFSSGVAAQKQCAQDVCLSIHLKQFFHKMRDDNCRPELPFVVPSKCSDERSRIYTALRSSIFEIESEITPCMVYAVATRSAIETRELRRVLDTLQRIS